MKFLLLFLIIIPFLIIIIREIIGIYLDEKEYKKQIDYLSYRGSKEYHEKEGDSICPYCNKKFVADSEFCTWDIVGDMDGQIKGWQKCPHCLESWTYDNGMGALSAIKEVRRQEEKVKKEVVNLRRSLIF